MAKNICDKYQIEYESKSKNDLLLSGEEPFGVTFPKIFTNDNRFIGGFRELEKMLCPKINYDKL